VGMALSVRLDKNNEQFVKYLNELNVGEAMADLIRQGFAASASSEDFMRCP